MPSTREGMTQVIILRHGASTFNVEGRYQGCSDESLLTQEGRADARLSGRRLCSEEVAAVVSSPLQRARETAREVRAMLQQSGHAVPFVTDARLREVDLSTWEGMHYDRVKKTFPAQLSAWRSQPSELRIPLPSGEETFPVRNLYDRTVSFWKDLVATYAGKSVLLVTHGGTARAMVTSALGLGMDYFQRVQQSNCGISCLRIPHSAGPASLALLNDTTHLSGALPKLKEGRTGVRLLLITADSDHAEDYLELCSILKRVAINRTLILSPVSSAVLSVFASHLGGERISESWLERNLQGILQKEMAGRAHTQVVLVARAYSIRRLLEHCLDLPRTVRTLLDLKEVGVTAIHWPGSGVPPILQGMNLFERKNYLTGGLA